MKYPIRFSLIAIALLGLALTPAAGAADAAKLAEGCANCHGKDGASSEPGVPTIAGQSADYLAATMAAYKTKERPCPETTYKAGAKKGTKTDMCQMVKDLPEGDLKDLGKFYSKKPFVRAAQNSNPELAAKGKKLHATNCEKCHSEAGSSPADDAGILAGQWSGYLEEQLKDFFDGKRAPPKKMKQMLDRLDKTSIEPLVNFYASQK